MIIVNLSYHLIRYLTAGNDLTPDMKKIILSLLLISLFCMTVDSQAARCGSKRVGGYTSHGKGSHYIGGTVKSSQCKNFKR